MEQILGGRTNIVLYYYLSRITNTDYCLLMCLFMRFMIFFINIIVLVDLEIVGKNNTIHIHSYLVIGHKI